MGDLQFRITDKTYLLPGVAQTTQTIGPDQRELARRYRVLIVQYLKIEAYLFYKLYKTFF